MPTTHENAQPTSTDIPDDNEDVYDFDGNRIDDTNSDDSEATPDYGTPEQSNDGYVPKHGAEVDLDDGMSPEEREAIAEDERNRYKGRELLSGSHNVLGAITEHGSNAANKVAQTWASVRNRAASPRKGFRKFLLTRAENKVAKKQDKFDNAQDDFLKTHSRIQGKLEKAQTKKDKRQKSYDTQTTRMDDRITKAEQYRVNEHQEFIDHLKDKKGRAVLRKDARQRFREQGASRWTSRKVAREFSERQDESVKGAAELALMSHATDRAHDKSRKLVSFHDKLRNDADKYATSSITKHEKANVGAEQSLNRISELWTLLPDAREALKVAKSELQTLDDDEETDTYDAAHIAAQEQYDHASRRLRHYEEELARAQSSLKRNERRAKRHEEDAAWYTASRSNHSKQYSQAREARIETRTRYNNVSNAADSALSEALNTKQTTDNNKEEE